MKTYFTLSLAALIVFLSTLNGAASSLFFAKWGIILILSIGFIIWSVKSSIVYVKKKFFA